MAGAGDDFPVELAFGQRAVQVGAGVVECVERPVHTGDRDSNAFDVERLEISVREVMNVGQSDEFRQCIPLCRSWVVRCACETSVCLRDDRTPDEPIAQPFSERSMSEHSQRLRQTPIPPGFATIPAWLGSKCLGVKIVERAGAKLVGPKGVMSMQAANVGDRRSSSRSLPVDELISAVHQHALEICEQELLSARGRLSNEQAHITRTVIEAIVRRLLAVPEARLNAASEERDYAELLAHLFELEPPRSGSGDASGSAGAIGLSSARVRTRPA